VCDGGTPRAAVPCDEPRAAKTGKYGTEQTNSMARLLKHFANTSISTALDGTN